MINESSYFISFNIDKLSCIGLLCQLCLLPLGLFGQWCCLFLLCKSHFDRSCSLIGKVDRCCFDNQWMIDIHQFRFDKFLKFRFDNCLRFQLDKLLMSFLVDKLHFRFDKLLSSIQLDRHLSLSQLDRRLSLILFLLGRFPSWCHFGRHWCWWLDKWELLFFLQFHLLDMFHLFLQLDMCLM